MKVRRIVLAVTLAIYLAAVGTNGASLLDLFNWEEAEKLLGKQVRQQDSDSRSCMCKGAACVCCVNLNITLVDLGGPGCVHMKYLSPEQGFAVNVSYGKSLLHSSTIKAHYQMYDLNVTVRAGANSPPICLDVFGKLAQMCARFSELAPTADGLRGCLQLEPRLLGDAQLDFPLGCFRSGPAGMEMEPPPPDQDNSQEGDEENEAEGEGEEGAESDSGISTEALLQVVNHTAEQGIAFFSSFLGLSPPQRNSTVATTSPASEPVTSSVEEPSDAPNTRRGKLLPSTKHPNTL